MKIPLTKLQVTPAPPDHRLGRIRRAALSILGAANVYMLLGYLERQRRREAGYVTAIPVGVPAADPFMQASPFPQGKHIEVLRAVVAQLHEMLSQGARYAEPAFAQGADVPLWAWEDEHGHPLNLDPRGMVVQSIALQPCGLLMISGTNVAGDEEWSYHVRTDPREVIADIIRLGWMHPDGLRAVHRFMGKLVAQMDGARPGPRPVPDPEEEEPSR